MVMSVVQKKDYIDIYRAPWHSLISCRIRTRQSISISSKWERLPPFAQVKAGGGRSATDNVRGSLLVRLTDRDCQTGHGHWVSLRRDLRRSFYIYISYLYFCWPYIRIAAAGIMLLPSSSSPNFSLLFAFLQILLLHVLFLRRVPRGRATCIAT